MPVRVKGRAPVGRPALPLVARLKAPTKDTIAATVGFKFQCSANGPGFSPEECLERVL